MQRHLYCIHTVIQLQNLYMKMKLNIKLVLLAAMGSRGTSTDTKGEWRRWLHRECERGDMQILAWP